MGRWESFQARSPFKTSGPPEVILWPLFFWGGGSVSQQVIQSELCPVVGVGPLLQTAPVSTTVMGDWGGVLAPRCGRALPL